MHCHSASGQWARTPCNSAPHRMGGVGCGTAAMHFPIACGMGSESFAMHRHSGWVVGVECVQCTATMLVGSWKWNCCNALRHCDGGQGIPIIQRRIVWEH